MKKILAVTLLLLVTISVQLNAQDKKDTRIRVIAIFAHPDDADSKMAGTAALLAKMGVAVKFVALTNGDAGHYAEGGGVLGKRRREEAQRAAKKYGIEEYTVLNNHDGELLPDLNVRLQVIREIRKWNADVVLAIQSTPRKPCPSAGHADPVPRRVESSEEQCTSGANLEHPETAEWRSCPRELQITERLLGKFGYTPGCIGCTFKEN